MEAYDISFVTIVGHDRPVNILKQALANKALAHAYLFSGEKGIGKKMTAYALAAAVNCEAAGPAGGCGACPSCRKVASRVHPDVYLLVADGDDIKIDQIRAVQNHLALRPFEGTKKVLIVDGAESLNPASSNAFLKTLEEPPGDTLIILVTELPQSLLATIRSRCQEIRFYPLPRQTLARALMERRGLSEEDAWFVAALAQGSMGRGFEMDVEREKADRKDIWGVLSSLTKMNPGEVLLHAETFSKDRDRFERLLDIGIEGLRDAMVSRVTGDSKLLTYAQGKAMHKPWVDRLSLQRMLIDLELFFISRGLLDRRVSAQLVAENLLLKLRRV
jgi:DNA polymerase III subunit delta'